MEKMGSLRSKYLEELRMNGKLSNIYRYSKKFEKMKKSVGQKSDWLINATHRKYAPVFLILIQYY